MTDRPTQDAEARLLARLAWLADQAELLAEDFKSAGYRVVPLRMNGPVAVLRDILADQRDVQARAANTATDVAP
jgi:hypothetical protein